MAAFNEFRFHRINFFNASNFQFAQQKPKIPRRTISPPPRPLCQGMIIMTIVEGSSKLIPKRKRKRYIALGLFFFNLEFAMTFSVLLSLIQLLPLCRFLKMSLETFSLSKLTRESLSVHLKRD